MSRSRVIGLVERSGRDANNDGLFIEEYASLIHLTINGCFSIFYPLIITFTTNICDEKNTEGRPIINIIVTDTSSTLSSASITDTTSWWWHYGNT